MLTPEQHASRDLFGQDDFIPSDKDQKFLRPQNPIERVSWNELVEEYRNAQERQPC
jgi:hypothetical protein